MASWREPVYKVAAGWHLLSLDAPSVAALWSWFFARAMHLHLPWTAACLLGAVTWLLYVADRILDGLRSGARDLLQERHYFHARHRRAFLVVASLLIVPVIWFACRMRPSALRLNLYISACVLAYLGLVHRRTRPANPGFPKEVLVGAIFAAATAVPAWSRLGVRKEQMLPAVALFALLCWMNCVGIDKWETSQISLHAHATTRWAGVHLRPIVTVIAFLAVAAATLAPSRGLMAVYLAAGLSSGIFYLLDALSARLAPIHLRIAADAALLTPLALFPLAR